MWELLDIDPFQVVEELFLLVLSQFTPECKDMSLTCRGEDGFCCLMSRFDWPCHESFFESGVCFQPPSINLAELRSLST